MERSVVVARTSLRRVDVVVGPEHVELRTLHQALTTFLPKDMHILSSSLPPRLFMVSDSVSFFVLLTDSDRYVIAISLLGLVGPRINREMPRGEFFFSFVIHPFGWIKKCQERLGSFSYQ